MNKSTYRLYNQVSAGVFKTPVFSEHALAVLKHYLGDFVINPHADHLELICSDDGAGQPDTGDLGYVLLETAWPSKPQVLGDKALFMSAVYYMNTCDPRWFPCVTAMERHCIITDDEGYDVIDEEELYISIYVLMEFLMYDPDSQVTSVCGLIKEDDGVVDVYISKQLFLHSAGYWSHDMGGRLNAAAEDNNPIQMATVLATHITDILAGINNTALANEVHCQLAAMLLNDAQPISDATYAHRVESDSADTDASLAIDLSKL